MRPIPQLRLAASTEASRSGGEMRSPIWLTSLRSAGMSPASKSSGSPPRTSAISTKLQLGLHSAVIPELEVLTARYPLRERFWAQLMTALYRAGRQAEALDAYRRAREVLAVELGADPSSSSNICTSRSCARKSEPAPASTTFGVPDMDAADEPGTGPGSDEGTIQTFSIAQFPGYTHFSQEHGDEAAGGWRHASPRSPQR